MRFDTAPVVGWRGWTVTLENPNLRCIMRQAYWPRRERLVAECFPDLIISRTRVCPPGASPQLNCDCGIYAFDTPEYVLDWLEEQPSTARIGGKIRVMGQVSLWGSIKEHEFGHRAQFAYPYSLTIASARRTMLPRRALDELRVRLQGGYGIDVGIAS